MAQAGGRERIFEATVAVLMEVGLQGAQTRAITERAGVGTGLLNHYFRWPDLRAAAWAAIFADVARTLRQPGETPRDAIDRFLVESFAPQARPLWRLWIEAEALAAQDPALAEAVSRARLALRDALDQLLQDGVADGSWSLTAPRQTAIRLEALRDGLIGLLLANDPDLTADAARAHLKAAFHHEVAR
jgi:AcrR family transcriptional regulator